MTPCSCDADKVSALSTTCTCHSATIEGVTLHQAVSKPRILRGNASSIEGVEPDSVDLIVTSPPYWRRRDYEHEDQLGWEPSAEAYTQHLVETLNSWIPLLHPNASVLLNIGDSYHKGFLVGVPAMFEVAARKAGWLVANHIIWAKSYGVPQPGNRRLASRHESVFHLTRSRNYYMDLLRLMTDMGKRGNPGDFWQPDDDVWQPHATRNRDPHVAPFPPELARWAIKLACPQYVCTNCGQVQTPIVEPTTNLNPDRPQALRALKLFAENGLTDEHLTAIRAVGISDAGKGKRVQRGAAANGVETKRLAAEAKKALGGYFREFTFGLKKQTGWQKCDCQSPTRPGLVLDPFMGTGTTLRVAYELGCDTVGVDLNPPKLSF